MDDSISAAENPSLPRLGSYQIIRALGSGGMSQVFQAVHADTGSIVALKVLPRKLAQNAVLLQRFLREAKSAESLDHPQIVAIYDRGFDLGRHYLVLEYVEGRDLFDRVRADGPLEPLEAVQFVRQVAEGLDYAARLGMIHRDVKPANLLMTPDHRAKIIDLGLAFQTDEEDERVTRDGTTVGTVDYMSPEQARDSRKLNERSDIYSLGCTFYYLLTGSPPFPGGNLADKLARHHSAAVPDVRTMLPAIPADLALLIQKMMAKKPEQRFANYGELIGGLDQIGQGPPVASIRQLDDVLIVDDDVDDDVIELTIAVPESDPVPARARANSKKPRVDGSRDPSASSSLPVVSLADLAALDAPTPSKSPRTKSKRLAEPANPQASAIVDALLEEDEEPAGTTQSLRRRSDELPLQTWIAAGVMVGLLVAVLVFGVQIAISLLKPEVEVTAKPGQEAEGRSAPETIAQPSIEREGSPALPTRPNAPTPRNPRPNPGSVSVVPIEPIKPTPRVPLTTEIIYPDSLKERLGIKELSSQPLIESASKIVVKRLADGEEVTQLTTLAGALDRASDLVEIADTGPLHEDDFQMAGKSKVIRGRGGLRPIVKIEATTQSLVREQPAKFFLGMNGIERLTIEGIDLVVDLRDLPLSQSTLFLCQGVELTVRDCTISIINAEDRRSGFSVFRLTSGPRPNLLTIDRSLIRGPIRTLVEAETQSSKIVLDRSVIVGSSGPLFRFAGPELEGRSIQLHRSLLLTREPVFAWDGKPCPTKIRALGTSFVHVDPATSSTWLSARSSTTSDLKSKVDYEGENNQWIGWVTMAQWGSTAVSKSNVLDEIRATWAGSDQSSQEIKSSWAVASVAETVTADSFKPILENLAPTLAMVATPHQQIGELTVDQFSRLATPALLDDLTVEAQPDPVRPTISLSFELDRSGSRDLGQFLSANVTDVAKRYVVRVSGTGVYPITPVRLPDGTSLVLAGPRGIASNQLIPVLIPKTTGLAIFELHQGDLAISNVGFANEGIDRTRHWIYLEDGLLALQRCRYRDLGPGEDTAGAAIVFSARSAQTAGKRAGGFASVPNLPLLGMKDCWINSSKEFVQAVILRGVVRVENSLIEAGDLAIRLQPEIHPGSKLEADLVLENCTIATDRSGVVLDPSRAEGEFAGRPWVIFSRASAFPRAWRRGGALLEVDPRIFTQGSLFWQSSYDLYEVSRFLRPIEGAESNGTQSNDLKRNWIDLWGINHTRGDRGPDSQKIEHILTYRERDRPKSTRPSLAQLELDPAVHKDRGANYKALPPLPR